MNENAFRSSLYRYLAWSIFLGSLDLNGLVMVFFGLRVSRRDLFALLKDDDVAFVSLDIVL